MISYPNSKINIGLSIKNKRSDGFHNLETIFYPINLCDCLEIVENNSNKNIFSHSGIQIGDDDNDNLCIKAYNILSKEYTLPTFDIHLHKQIPIGAGLGGGSADASYMLKMLNEYCDLNISDTKLENYASRLGSDCSLFIKNRACFGEGRGEILSEINIDLSEYTIVLINPNIFVSTKDAFSNLKLSDSHFKLKTIEKLSLKDWHHHIKNDFENNVFNLHPEILNIKNNLYNMGAIYASMSGSGSTVYGIFDKIDKSLIKEKFNKYYLWFG